MVGPGMFDGMIAFVLFIGVAIGVVLSGLLIGLFYLAVWLYDHVVWVEPKKVQEPPKVEQVAPSPGF